MTVNRMFPRAAYRKRTGVSLPVTRSGQQIGARDASRCAAFRGGRFIRLKSLTTGRSRTPNQLCLSAYARR